MDTRPAWKHQRVPTTQRRLTAHPSTGRRIPGIEGLRAIAATSIVVYHVWGSASAEGAPVGVDGRFGHLMTNLSLGVALFFCLSGFLLYRPFAASLLRGAPLPDRRAYARNRVLRILPAFWVCAVIAIILLGQGQQRDGTLARPEGLREIAQLLTLSNDWFPSTIGTGFPVTWSLAVEAVFYVVLPLLATAAALGAAHRVGSARPLAAALLPVLTLAAIGFGTRFFLLALTDGWDWSDWYGPLETGFLGQADLFASGMLVAIVDVQTRDGRWRPPARWRRAVVPLACGLLALAAWQMPVDAQLTANPWNCVATMALSLFLAAVVLPAHAGAPRALALLEWRPVAALGVISYSVFLWHQPVIDELRAHGLTGSGPSGLVINLVVVMAVTAAVSWVSYRVVEAPALRHKQPMTRRGPGATAGAVRDTAALSSPAR